MHRATQLQIFLVVLILGFLAGPRVIGALQQLDVKNGTPVANVVESDKNAAGRPVEAINSTPAVNPYSILSLRAKSVYVWDIYGRRKLYDQNGDMQLPLASVTK